jgi:hypothetical protein
VESVTIGRDFITFWGYYYVIYYHVIICGDVVLLVLLKDVIWEDIIQGVVWDDVIRPGSCHLREMLLPGKQCC